MYSAKERFFLFFLHSSFSLSPTLYPLPPTPCPHTYATIFPCYYKNLFPFLKENKSPPLGFIVFGFSSGLVQTPVGSICLDSWMLRYILALSGGFEPHSIAVVRSVSSGTLNMCFAWPARHLTKSNHFFKYLEILKKKKKIWISQVRIDSRWFPRFPSPHHSQIEGVDTLIKLLYFLI